MTAPSSQWVAVAVLPNLEIGSAIEAGVIALAPWNDFRVENLKKMHSNFHKFLNKFTDAFGEKAYPAVLLVQKNAPSSVFTIEAIASFRNAVAISVVSYSRAKELTVKGGSPRIIYSNTFWLYPWMLDKHYKDIIAQTPALLAVHEVATFRGQCTPEILRMSLADWEIDWPLLNVLLTRWHRYYAGPKRKKWDDRALFRSLNMANQAALLPAGNDTTIFDVGRSISLWVSAFEILAHPGKGKSDLAAVYGLLEKVTWKLRPSNSRRYKAYNRKKNNSPRTIFFCWLYGEIYKVRNDFLHGNRVRSDRLILKGIKQNIFKYAAPLYRLALTGFLPMSLPKRKPSIDDPNAFGKYIAESMEFNAYQEVAEKAVLTARKK